MTWDVFLLGTLVNSDFLVFTRPLIGATAKGRYINPLMRERARQEADVLAFQFRDGDRLVIGLQADASAFLDENHRFARERSISNPAGGRANPMILAYVAPHETAAPSLEVLRHAAAEDVEVLLERAHAGERDIDHQRSFDHDTSPASAWSQAARSLSQGKEQLAIFVDGERRAPSLLVDESPASGGEPEPARRRRTPSVDLQQSEVRLVPEAWPRHRDDGRWFAAKEPRLLSWLKRLPLPDFPSLWGERRHDIEKEMVNMMVDGKTTAAIAQACGVHEAQVIDYLRSIDMLCRTGATEPTSTIALPKVDDRLD
ncbi:hypothetical protein DDF62_14465 [Caulobacter radicis]|uniref:hypothetical protein n=1 Tax=Caulobacter radicis TaxID=2172650 RepID=UPI000D572D45|nr:hypothetical protein [Caulobacter radicis]PVM88398.1 hypothetical protein DDF62_14465 [Caulobacter radicis]